MEGNYALLNFYEPDIFIILLNLYVLEWICINWYFKNYSEDLIDLEISDFPRYTFRDTSHVVRRTRDSLGRNTVWWLISKDRIPGLLPEGLRPDALFLRLLGDFSATM